MPLTDEQKPIVKEIIRAHFEEVRRGRVNVFKNVALFIAYEIPGIEKKVMASIEGHPALQDVHFSYELRVHIHDELVACLMEQLSIIDPQLGPLSPTPHSITPGAGSPPDQRGGGAAAAAPLDTSIPIRIILEPLGINGQQQLVIDHCIKEQIKNLKLQPRSTSLEEYVDKKIKEIEIHIMSQWEGWDEFKGLNVDKNQVEKYVKGELDSQWIRKQIKDRLEDLDRRLQGALEYFVRRLPQGVDDGAQVGRLSSEQRGAGAAATPAADEVEQQEVKIRLFELYDGIYRIKAAFFIRQFKDPLKASEVLKDLESHVKRVIEDIQKEVMAQWKEIYGATDPDKLLVIENYVAKLIIKTNPQQKLLDRVKKLEQQQAIVNRAQVGGLSSDQRGGGAAAPRDAAAELPIVQDFDKDMKIILAYTGATRWETSYEITSEDAVKIVFSKSSDVVSGLDKLKSLTDRAAHLTITDLAISIPTEHIQSLAHMIESVQRGDRPRYRQ